MIITTVDAHTAGEPFRVITGGFPELPGDTILARRRYAREHLDHLRRALMWEPRGHADMYGCIVTPPVTPGADLGVLFIHNEGFSTMCGHGIIGIATVALETGMLPAGEPETTLRIDTPAGLVTAHALVDSGKVRSVRFENVPSFVLALDRTVDVPGYGRVRYDIAFGGAFYAYVQAEDLELRCLPADYRRLIEAGVAVKRAVMAAGPISHPFEADLSFLYGTIFIDPPEAPDSHSRNVCVFADGEVDRCPTGTGVSGRLALHHARGELAIDQSIIVESIIGSRFSGRVVETTTFGPHPAIIPEVTGSAYITGHHEFIIDPDDPLRDGFLLR
ncbi:MAG: proline racemase family protein [Caldilineae bacterium]|nr:proline racemase family protein [Anaerolineae bacterium]MCB9154308.1 proline racemase family protein [Caldilineae bacterium]